MAKQFTRVQEDFICDVCGSVVHGNGYTNHCPHCLTSKHVDIYPGDRSSPCQGTMPAVSMEIKGSTYVLTQKCVKCVHIRKNKTAENDSAKALRALSKGELPEFIAEMRNKKPS